MHSEMLNNLALFTVLMQYLQLLLFYFAQVNDQKKCWIIIPHRSVLPRLSHIKTNELEAERASSHFYLHQPQQLFNHLNNTKKNLKSYHFYHHLSWILDKLKTYSYLTFLQNFFLRQLFSSIMDSMRNLLATTYVCLLQVHVVVVGKKRKTSLERHKIL